MTELGLKLWLSECLVRRIASRAAIGKTTQSSSGEEWPTQRGYCPAR